VRIIAGEWRGRKLVAPEGQQTRPTADRTRETLFSMLASRLGSFEGLRVADLYAGSGALGFEALSRGSDHATFVETERAALKAIEANSKSLGADNRIAVRAMSAASLPAGQPFDLVFADPPYETGSGTAVVEAVVQSGWLAPGGWMAVETHRGDAVAPPDGWEVDAERDVGRARLTILRA
jgi:16S rRNA (guanine966-N2)-methyltransferase